VDASTALSIPELNIPGLSGGLPVISPEGYAQLGAAEGVPVSMRTVSHELNEIVRWTILRHRFESAPARSEGMWTATRQSGRAAERICSRRITQVNRV
jgi:hypothetical protein